MNSRFLHHDEILGRGSFKTVFKAFDKLRGTACAWNEIELGDALSESGFKSIYKEVQLIKQLHHPHIIDFVESWIDEENCRLVFITELMTGGTLRNLCNRLNSLIPLRAVSKWTREILSALQYLHGRNIIHRDIKPSNVFIGEDGVKIGDLGLATIDDNQQQGIVGTLEYVAPEMFSEHYGCLVDIWALGLLVLAIVTDADPYAECRDAPGAIYLKITSMQLPQSLTRVLPESRVASFIRTCLTPADQRQTAMQLLRHPFIVEGHLLRGTNRDILRKDRRGAGHTDSTPPGQIQVPDTIPLHHLPTPMFPWRLCGCTWLSVQGRLLFICLASDLVDTLVTFEVVQGQFKNKSALMKLENHMWDRAQRPCLGLTDFHSISAPVGGEHVYVLSGPFVVKLRLNFPRHLSDPLRSAQVVEIFDIQSRMPELKHAMQFHGMCFNQEVLYVAMNSNEGPYLIHGNVSKPLNLRLFPELEGGVYDVAWYRAVGALIVLSGLCPSTKSQKLWYCDTSEQELKLMEIVGARPVLLYKKSRGVARGLSIRGDKASFVFDNETNPILLSQSILRAFFTSII